MPRRKQLAPKRLKGVPGKDAEGEGGDDDSRCEEMEDGEEDENDEEKSPLSPTASWSVKFTPFGSTTEKVMGTSIPAGSPSIVKVHSKGTWYPDESDDCLELSHPALDSSYSEGEQEKPVKKPSKRKGSKDSSHKETSKEKKAERKVEREKKHKVSGYPSKEREPEFNDRQHSPSSAVRENLRHYFLDKLKSSGKMSSPEDEGMKRKLPSEDGHSEERASLGSHHARDSYTHTVLWKPPAYSARSPSGSSHLANTNINKQYGESTRRTTSSNRSKTPERAAASREEVHGSSGTRDSQEMGLHRGSSRSSPNHSSEPEKMKKSYGSDESVDASSLSRSLSPSDFYHHTPAGMAYYPSPFLGYGLYPSYPNLVYPYNYGYVVAVPGGLFIPMGHSSHSSYTPSSSTEGHSPSSSNVPHKENLHQETKPQKEKPQKETPLDLSSCPPTKKEKVEVKPKIIKEEPKSEKQSTSSKPESSSQKKRKGDKTVVLWKKVPRHAMMMDMAQLSVLEKVHVLYTTESTFLCFICSDCNALFNSLDLLVLHAVGTAHTSKDDIDVKAMGQKGFEVVPIDKIAKKQKHVEKKPDFSFESPLQSTVSLHRRRMPGAKESVAKNRDVYKCSVCPDTFPNFLRYTMHMNETGHRRKSVRYTDVYKAQKQVKKILKCMNCEKSFMTLEELTMHMIKTKHYSDIAGGFANQSEPEDDGDYDNLCPPEEGQQFDSTDYQHPLDVSTTGLSQKEHGAYGTSSDSESPRSLRDSPVGHWRSPSRLDKVEREQAPPGDVTQVHDRHSHLASHGISPSKGRRPSVAQDQGRSSAGPSQSGHLPPPRQKRAVRETQEERRDESISKRIKMEAESEAEDDDHNFGGYESENEFEEDEDADSFDPEYSYRLFQHLHPRDGEAENSSCLSQFELSRRKYRTRIYKHSLLYRTRDGSDLKQGVSAFDGLYKWAKSLGLLSSPPIALAEKTPQAQPKAVVKCDSKYVDPDNFDVTLPYGGKVRPDIDPLSKLSSMVETTQTKQPKTNSFESNFIMDKAYANFEKNQRYSAPPHALNLSIRSEEVTNTGVGRSHNAVLGSGNSTERTLGSADQRSSWPVDGTMSQDAVLEKLIVKAYDKPMRSSYAGKDEVCSCNADSREGTVNERQERLSPRTRKGNEPVETPDSARARVKTMSGIQSGINLDACMVCLRKKNPLRSRMSQQSEGGENKRPENLHGKGSSTATFKKTKEDEAQRTLGEEQDNDRAECSSFRKGGFFSAPGKEHLQGLIYGQKDPVREVKFTWADAIDTLISRSFGAEVETPEQMVTSMTVHGRMGMELGSQKSSEDHKKSGEARQAEETRLTPDKEPGNMNQCGSADVPRKQEQERSGTSPAEYQDNDRVVKHKGTEGCMDEMHERSKDSRQVSPVGSRNVSSSSDRTKERGRSEKGDCPVKAESTEVMSCRKSEELESSDPGVDSKSGGTKVGSGSPRNEEAKQSGMLNDKVTLLHKDKVSKVTDSCEEKLGKVSVAEKGASSSASCMEKNEEFSVISQESRLSGPANDIKLKGTEQHFEKGENCPEDRKISERMGTGGSLHESRDEDMDQIDEEPTQNMPAAVSSGTDQKPDQPPSDGKSQDADLSRQDAKHHQNEKKCSPGRVSPKQQLSNSRTAMNRPMGYLKCGSPPPLIPTADASTKAIQHLEELTRKPAVTNVKEMILSKIHEEVEKLMGASGGHSQSVSRVPPHAVQYLAPRIENSKECDTSGKSLKSLEELSKRAPATPYQGVRSDPRIKLNSEQSLVGGSNPGLKYLLPSSVPETSVSAIQSLEKLSNEHPVLRRNVRVHPSEQKECPPVPVPAEKVQYLPPSFGHEAVDADSIRSLERFSSRHNFFPFTHERLHSRRHVERQHEPKEREVIKSEKETGMGPQKGCGHPKESPLLVSIPKLEPLSPEDVGTKETSATRIKEEPSEEKNGEETAEKTAAVNVPTSSKDPLLALDNLVKKKQDTDVTPSPRKVALEIVNKDLKPPYYIMPPDAKDKETDNNPLEEIDKMMKFP